VQISATDPIHPGVKVGGPFSLPFNVTVTENLFLCVMKQLFTATHPSVIKQTEALFKNEELTLSEVQFEKLTKSWQQVVDFVANPSNACACLGTPTADLILLNRQTEELFNRIRFRATIS
jgi:hypothetical protein